MSQKYELVLDDTINGLTRIRALRDIPQIGVKAGDLGGYIQDKKNLSHEGACWVFDDSCAYGNSRVFGDSRVFGGSSISGNSHCYGNSCISDNSHCYGDSHISGSCHIFGNSHCYGNSHISGSCHIFGNSHCYGDSHISGSCHIFGGASICGDADIKNVRDYCVFTNVGSENGILTVCKGKNGLLAVRGCFSGSLDEFEDAVNRKSTAQIKAEYALLIQFARLRLGGAV